MAGQLESFTGLDECSRACARHVSQRLAVAVAERGRATMVLAGGRTPRLVYKFLAQAELVPPLAWERVHLFWGDERFVPWDAPESNYAFGREHLINHIPIPAENVHRVPVEKSTPELAAMEYENMLHHFFAGEKETKAGLLLPPRFDVVLLGIGLDGHTASLFAGDDLACCTHWVIASRSSMARPPVPRITLTLPLLNRARAVVFLAAGADKRRLAEAIATGDRRIICPAACVQPEGELAWYIAAQDQDMPAARQD